MHCRIDTDACVNGPTIHDSPIIVSALNYYNQYLRQFILKGRRLGFVCLFHYRLLHCINLMTAYAISKLSLMAKKQRRE